MLNVNNLSVVRGGKTLFEELTFEILPGQILQVVGENGSGKSSLAQAIAGDIKPTKGTITRGGKIAYLMQDREINFPLTAREFIQLGNPQSDISRRADQLNLRDCLDKKVTQISIGQFQRCEFAQILLYAPDLLILDEPFSAQDKSGIALFLALLKELKNERKAILLINHLEIDTQQLVDKTIEIP